MCQNRKQKEYLAGIYADQLYTSSNFVKAAETYANSSRRFEDVCLKFLGPERHEDALERYLACILDKFKLQQQQEAKG
jgi:hypothetical protein